MCIRDRDYKTILYITILLLFSLNLKPIYSDTIPLYEPQNNDYRLSQTIKGAIRFGYSGFLLTGLIGLVKYHNILEQVGYTYSYLELEPILVAATTIGFFSSLIGILFGYATGVEYNSYKQKHSNFHSPKDNLGAKILLIFNQYPLLLQGLYPFPP